MGGQKAARAPEPQPQAAAAAGAQLVGRQLSTHLTSKVHLAMKAAQTPGLRRARAGRPPSGRLC